MGTGNGKGLIRVHIGATLVVLIALFATSLAQVGSAAAQIAGSTPPASLVLDAGRDTTCAIAQGDVVTCWGADLTLADPESLDAEAGLGVPRTIEGFSARPVAISVGYRHACVVLESGAIECWGRNADGQLGDGTEAFSATPVQVQGLGGAAVDVGAGTNFTCALLDTGVVTCWGATSGTRLGADYSSTNELVPRPVPDLAPVASLSTRGGRTCVLFVSATTTCWGSNFSDSAGLKFPAAEPVSAGVPFGEMVSIEVGLRGDCGVAVDGSAKCRGGTLDVDNALAVTGVNSDFEDHCVVTEIGRAFCFVGDGLSNGVDMGIDDAVAITAGSRHHCVATATGDVQCWGHNDSGQVSDPSGDLFGPTRVFETGGEITEIGIGADHTCINNGGTRPWCVGDRSRGQLGAPTTSVPARSFQRLDASFELGYSMDVRNDQSCVVSGDEVLCWGSGPIGDFATPTFKFRRTNTAQVALGGNHQCIRRSVINTDSFGPLRCWGNNNAGQVGVSGSDPGSDGFATSQRVSLPTGVVGPVQAELGSLHSCALVPTFGVYCWGNSVDGQAGPNATSDQHVPVSVPLNPAPIDLAVGSTHSCAVNTFRRVHCWGSNFDGELGQDPASVPFSPQTRLVSDSNVSGVDHVVAGNAFTCALTSGLPAGSEPGQVWCWGRGDSGLFGTGDSMTTHVPQRIDLPGSVTAIGIGRTHACAAIEVDDISDPYELYCWGEGANMELGNFGFAAEPQLVAGVTLASVEPAMCAGRPVTINMQAGASGAGTTGNDVILGTSGNDTIDAGAGNDVVCAGAGNDVVVGGDGNDILFGEDGKDIMRGNAGVDFIRGGPGDDRLLGGIGDDSIMGDTGNDFLGGFGGADTIEGFDGNDTIYGGFGADMIDAGAGDDLVFGLIGNDIIVGGRGNDTLNGDRGNDTINGGLGNDLINGGNANDILNGEQGNDIVNGGKADDTLSGGPDTDTCTGNKQNVADTADATCETTFGIP